jgi:hypothetical protein
MTTGIVWEQDIQHSRSGLHIFAAIPANYSIVLVWPPVAMPNRSILVGKCRTIDPA